VLALTWVPAVATWVYRRGVKEKETWLVRGVKRFYQPLLRRAVGAPVKVMVGAGVLLTVAMATVPLLGAVFVPKLDEGAVAIQAVRLASVSLERSLEMTTRVEKALLASFPDAIKTVVSKTGRPEIATDPMGVELSDIFVMLKPRSEWSRYGSKEALVAKMQRVLKDQVPGQNYAFSQPIELRTNELISGVRSDVAISLYGDDLATLKRVGGAIAASVRGIQGAKDVKVEQVAGLPVLRVQIDRQRIARYGINAEAVLHAVEAMGGRKVGEVYEGARRFALRVRYVRTARTDLDTIRRIPVAAPSGQLVPLGQLAKLSIEPGPAQISRHRVQRRLSVEVNVRGRDLAGFVAEARARIDAANLVPAGYFVEWGGQFENLRAAADRLIIAVPVALLLILGLLYATYRSLRPALVIFLNVPFAVTGGVLALLARGMPFSISAGVGFIALSGIAVLNGVVLLSYIYKLQDEGKSAAEAAYAGAVTRLRPVLMTAMVAAFGFVPMALATSAGAEVQRPLATVVIGGLLTSTLLTLFVIPAIWTRFGSAQRTA
ncbi:MAG: efflux RND transporter permease subunit, partial [Deltaproteobacteria bacterium]|nr:efflux RND transporter permease subunit [Deltaproteobacteria bacterium]